MKNVLIDFDRYYINQADPNYADIRFKNDTAVKSYGCGVCCEAMIICRELGLAGVADKQSVIRRVISDSTNAHGLMTYSNVTYNGQVFKFTIINARLPALMNNEPVICQLPGHFVVVNGYDSKKSGDEAYLIKDPGASANSKLLQPMKKYGADIRKMFTLKV